MSDVALVRDEQAGGGPVGDGPVSDGPHAGGRAHATRRTAERREELLQAALAVIRSVGPGASMEQMAAEAGITKPVLYRYFGDRDGLIGAVAESFAEELAGRLAAAVAPLADSDPEIPIRAGIEAYISFIEEDPALYGFLSQHAAPDSLALVAVVDRVARDLTSLIAARLAEAGLDPRPAGTFAHGLVGMVHMAGARWARQPELPRDEFVSYLVGLASYGLATGGLPVQQGE